ncbi:hypothetical protein GTA08_BOTSDO04267 [Neofusicoccum parvum]|uniref:Uncharacterized protein n=1 Tax=Neofusicoccum parvum TaxID=310453 RepID=A0ACB5SEX3_9PEZI|nr:hypothetical protein GTA08_BOTSDO04267 [Neofusicoccum parvum]GME37737.1 hypothetical protein GTA08_BOTSDO04267 [Neofusicoccum parvum]
MSATTSPQSKAPAHASNHPQTTRAHHASPTGLPTPAASPQAHSTASSPSPPGASQPRRMHNMSISSILSPADHAASSCAQIPEAAAETPSSSACSAGSRNSVAEETPAQQFTWNEDPKKINDMLRSLNPDSAEWVVWKDWADFLEEERERVAAERKAAAATAGAQGTG